MFRYPQQLIFYIASTIVALISLQTADGAPPNKDPEKGTPSSRVAINPPTLKCSSPVCSPWTKKFIEQQLESFQYKYTDIKFIITSEQSSGTAEAEHIVNSIQSQNFSRTVIRFNNDIYNRVTAKLNNPNWHTEHLVNFVDDPTFVTAHTQTAVDHVLSQKDYKEFLPGAILESRINCIWINQSLARKIGINITGPEFSVEELMNAAQKLNQYNQVATNQIHLLHAKNPGMRVHKLFSSIYLSSLCNDKGELPLRHDQQACETALKQALKIMYSLATPTDPFRRDETSTKDLFINDQLLFHIDFTISFAQFTEQKNKEWLGNIKPLALCTTGPFNYSTGYHSTFWAILKNAPHSERASKFMQNLASPKIAAEWTRKTKSATGIAGSLYDPSYSNDALGQFIRHQNNKQNGTLTPMETLLETQWPWGPCPQNSQLRDIIQNLLTRQITPETAFSQLTKPE